MGSIVLAIVGSSGRLIFCSPSVLTVGSSVITVDGFSFFLLLAVSASTVHLTIQYIQRRVGPCKKKKNSHVPQSILDWY